MLHKILTLLSPLLLLLIGPNAYAADGANLDLTQTTAGWFCVGLFVIAYAFVMLEEKLHLRKSKPVLAAAGIIWVIIGWIYTQHEQSALAEQAFRHTLLEFAELMLFLLVAMTYINAMDERGLFNALRGWLIKKGFSYRQLFWITGLMAFFISPIADNLTTALLMCAVVLKIAENEKAFINMCCVNIIVAANAGGAFSPFGDITTLMVWQAGKVDFFTFFHLFLPSLTNFLVPAAIMSFFIQNKIAQKDEEDLFLETLTYKEGAFPILLLFLATIASAVLGHVLIHMPPVLGMMLGLAYLKIYGFYLRKKGIVDLKKVEAVQSDFMPDKNENPVTKVPLPFDVFQPLARLEWDTLLFFYGVIMCVGGLGFMGYLTLMSESLYGNFSETVSNISLGLVSAVIDNIPVMYAVLTMAPDFSHGQWLLITLTTGVGGSMLSIGSAAGVALMGQARGYYTFLGHLKWTPVVALGYFASVYVHLWLNHSLF
ncbi:sodium:proton antiporter NhaD [Cellvibrio sp. UBA7661]|uniref:sodium:proton antiporter NhaD n=1 Tax=Cellvibrio sp. UBA7661 TaxID=1946311 RepID=UPI002F3515B2